jgi:transposase
MLGEAMYTTIKTLKELGKSKSEIARITGHDWKTVQKVIREIDRGTMGPWQKERKSIVDPYKETVTKLIEEGLTAVRIHEEITVLGFKGTYTAVKKYVRKIKGSSDIFVRMHTPAGQEAQVDFGYTGRTKDDTGRLRKTWVFNMRLSYSRFDYYEKVYDQKVETFINCHINAFEYFAGIPEVVKIDNLKAAILEANFYEPVYQRMYRDFAGYYGFKPMPCRVYHPNDKGKVESGIKYVKGNFFKGRSFTNSADCDRKLRIWNEAANKRIHGTTKKVPIEVFEREEKARLLPLPLQRYQLCQAGSRLVYHDCHIYVENNYYSVPFEYVGREVEIELSDTLLRIFYKGMQIAVHNRMEGKGQFSTEQSHYPKYKQYSETEHQEKYQARMADIGVFAEQLFFLILKENSRFWHQPVKGILSLTKKYQKDIVELACRRALSYGAYQYHIVRNICENGTYTLPVEFESVLGGEVLQ